MSKRVCISLLHAPLRSHQSPHRCSLQAISTTVRGDLHHHHQHHHFPLSWRQRQQRLPFSTSPRQQVSAARQVTNRKQSQPSMNVTLKSQQQRAQDSGLMLEHVGILEGTFVPPTGRNLPSPFRDWRGRLKLEYRRILRTVVDTGRNWFQAIWLITPRPKISLGKREAPRVAQRLFEEMNAHFAQGDISTVERSLSPGLISNLRGRIAQRPGNTSLLWTLHRHLSAPKVVSHRLALMPGSRKNSEQMGIEQVVVRIRSRQSLLKMQKMRVLRQGKSQVESVVVDGEGHRIEDENVEDEKRRMSKDTNEYVVVQRFLMKSKFGPWQLWGTAEESTLDKIRREEKAYNEILMKEAQRRV